MIGLLTLMSITARLNNFAKNHKEISVNNRVFRWRLVCGLVILFFLGEPDEWGLVGEILLKEY